MLKQLLAALAVLFALPAAAQTPPLDGTFTSLTDEFVRFYDETASLPEAERVARLRARFEPLFPGFYTPRGRDPARYDKQTATALSDFPAVRDKFLKASGSFAASFETAQARFRRFFPDFSLTMPVYLVHSLGEMDGGKRTINGRNVAVFGADVIAKYHDDTTIGPFLDHELFHIYHGRYMPDCAPLWCALWQEGLAVYVASRLNPGVDDRGLMLTIPRPIRPEVEPRLGAAMCLARAKFDSTAPGDYSEFFYGNGSGKLFPPRFGYFLGLVVAQKLGEKYTLRQLAQLPAKKIRPLVLRTVRRLADCPKR